MRERPTSKRGSLTTALKKGKSLATQRERSGVSFQDLILRLHQFWGNQGCLILQSYDNEMGAGTFHPATFLGALGPKPWSAAFVQACRRPTDGRYGENPNRLQHYYQYQVIMKPAPHNIQDLYLESLTALGIPLQEHDIRFMQDDWESPTLGAWGLGWEVRLDGMEVTQFTYFQEIGGIPLDPICAEITYGLERIAMYLQGVDNLFNLVWARRANGASSTGSASGASGAGSAGSAGKNVLYGDIHHRDEVEYSKHNFEHADVNMLKEQFALAEKECGCLLKQGLVRPAYDYCIKSSHGFNLLDARGALAVAERVGYIARVRHLARQVAQAYLKDEVCGIA